LHVLRDFWDAPFENNLDGARYFRFSTRDDLHVQEFNQVGFFDREDKFRLFKIESVVSTSDSDGHYVEAICQASMLELRGKVVHERRPQNRDPRFMLDIALEGTRYRSGRIDSRPPMSTSFFFLNGIEIINQIAQLFDIEVEERIEVNDNRIVGRFIDLVNRKGQDLGRLLEIDHEVMSMAKRASVGHIATRYFGRGSSISQSNEERGTEYYTRRITFADVEWRRANGDPLDKPRGQIWLEDPELTERFGLIDGNRIVPIEGIYENNSEEDPEVLLRETWEFMQRNAQPHFHFEMDVFMLGDLIGHEARQINLGDTVRTINRNFQNPIAYEARITKLTYDVSDKAPVATVEIGQGVNLFADDDRLSNLEREVETIGTRPIPDLNYINPIIRPVTGFIVQPLFASVALFWDFQRTGVLFELVGSRVRGFAPSSAHRLYLGSSNGFHHNNLGTNERFYYRIRATNLRGDVSAWSEEVSAETVRLTDISEEVRNAVRDAENAFNEANTANNTATHALNTAERSLGIANTAQGTAQNAQGVANNAQGMVNTIRNDVTAITNEVRDANGNLAQSVLSAQGSATIASNAAGQATQSAQTAGGHATTATNSANQATSAMQTAQGLVTTATNASNAATLASQTAEGFRNQAQNSAGQASEHVQTAQHILNQVMSNDYRSLITQTANSWSAFIGNHTGNLTSILANQDLIDMRIHGQQGATFFQISNGQVVIRADRIRLSGQTQLDGTFQVGTTHISDRAITVEKLAAGIFVADNITSGTLRSVNITGVNIEGSNITGTTISGTTVNGSTINGTTINTPNGTAPHRIVMGSQGTVQRLSVFANNNEMIRIHPVLGNQAGAIDFFNSNGNLMGIVANVINPSGDSGTGFGAVPGFRTSFRAGVNPNNRGGADALWTIGNSGATFALQFTSLNQIMNFSQASGSILYKGYGAVELEKGKPLALDTIQTIGYVNNGTVKLSRHLIDDEPCTMLGNKRYNADGGIFIGDDGKMGIRLNGTNYLFQEKGDELKLWKTT